MKQNFTIILMCLCLSACVVHYGAGSYRNPTTEAENVFGDIEVPSGQEVNNVQSVNGSIKLSHRVTTGKVQSVNGNVEIGDWVRVAHIATINGNVTIGKHFKADHKIETINGDIKIGKKASIRGNLQTINGNIELHDVLITGLLHNMNGNIDLRGNTEISGDLIYKRDDEQSADNTKRPVLTIEKTVKIEGSIILERPVELRLSDPALGEKVVIQY